MNTAELAAEDSAAVAEIERCKTRGNRAALEAAYDEGIRIHAEGGMILATARTALCAALGRTVEQFEQDAEALRDADDIEAADESTGLSAGESDELLDLRLAAKQEALAEVAAIARQVAEGHDFDEDVLLPALARAGVEVHEFTEVVAETCAARREREESLEHMRAMFAAARGGQ